MVTILSLRLCAVGDEVLVTEGGRAASAFNFGPADHDARPVEWIADHLCAHVDGAAWRAEPRPGQVHEAGLLKLDSAKAARELGWRPRWGLETALTQTARWHQAWRRGEDMAAFSLDQIRAFEAAS